MTDRELMQQALDALKVMRPACFAENTLKTADTAITALRDRLAQTEQGPVAWQGVHDHTDLYYRKPPQADVRPLYINPPAQPSPVLQQAYSTSAAYTVGFKDGQATQRPWVGLTDEDVAKLAATYLFQNVWPHSTFAAIHAIEAKIKEKNT